MKTCALCKKEIDTLKEKYVHVEDYDRGAIVKDLWCHQGCFHKAMNRELTDLEKQAKGMLERALPLLNRFAPPQEFEVT